MGDYVRLISQLSAMVMLAVLPTYVFADDVSNAVAHCYEGNAGVVEQTQCLGATIEKLEKQLDKVYQKALNAMPEQHENDARKSREQLRVSQAAWTTYKNENCALIGGMEGGTNLWVTHFGSLCEVEAVIKRTEFLSGIADNP